MNLGTTSHERPQHLDWLCNDQGTRLIRFLIWLLLGLITPLILLTLLKGDAEVGARWQILPTVVCASLAAWYLLRRGRHELAVGVLLWGLWLTVSLQCLVFSGLRSPAAIAYPVLLMLAGWLMGFRSVMLMFGLTVLCVSALALATWRNGFAPVVSGSPLGLWVTYVSVSSLACLLAAHMARSSREQFAQTAATRDALTRNLEELRTSQSRFELLFRLVPVPISVARLADGSTLEANAAWFRLMGYSREEAIGRTSIELGIWPDPAKRLDWVAAIRRDGRLDGYTVRFRTRNGSLQDLLVYAETVNFQGQDAIFVAHLDITERLRIEKALHELNAELEHRVEERTASLTDAIATLQRAQDELVQSEKLASLGAMVAGLAHELNTPIGNALTVATTLHDNSRDFQRSYTDNALRRSSLEQYVGDACTAAALIERSLGRASEVIQSFKQVAIDQASERRRRFSVRQLVEDLTETLRPATRNRPIRVRTDFQNMSSAAATGGDIEMDGYPGPLGQVIANLIENAMLHGFDGRDAHDPGEITITVRGHSSDLVEFCVRDNGCGISDEHIGRIFDPFFTTKLGQGGSGLGLSIAYRLVTTLLGGSIHVESHIGDGTTFVVMLPRLAPEQIVKPS